MKFTSKPILCIGAMTPNFRMVCLPNCPLINALVNSGFKFSPFDSINTFDIMLVDIANKHISKSTLTKNDFRNFVNNKESFSIDMFGIPSKAV